MDKFGSKFQNTSHGLVSITHTVHSPTFRDKKHNVQFV